MEADELIALGLYDPTDVHADLRLELLDYLVALGATADELLDNRDMLPGLAGVLAIQVALRRRSKRWHNGRALAPTTSGDWSGRRVSLNLSLRPASSPRAS